MQQNVLRSTGHIRVLKYFLFVLAFVCVSVPVPVESAGPAGENIICAVYISGIGCHNCALTDPVLLTQFIQKYPKLVIFKYEIYKDFKENQGVKDDYFEIYLRGDRPGVPFFVLNNTQVAVGRTQVSRMEESLKRINSNPFPSRYGFSIDFGDLDITGLPGKFTIWTKNRVLLSGKGGDNEVLKRILTTDDITQALSGVVFTKTDPVAVAISESQIPFEYAVKIGDWIMQWNGTPLRAIPSKANITQTYIQAILFLLIFLALSFVFFDTRRKIRKGEKPKNDWRTRKRDVLISGFALLSLVVFFLLARNISPDALKESGYRMPLVIFTFIIGLLDGINPCNMFVLTCMLTLLIASSSSRGRLYIVAFSFVGVVFIFYFTFMAAWLNVFKYIGFIRPLSIALGVIAIIAGLINCKELFFFHKGISLTIQDQHKGPLMRRMDNLKQVIQTGSLPLLVSSSIGLAVLSSLVELPCTAGFPIIYTGVLAGRGLTSSWAYYFYLVYYNVLYVLPLFMIISIFIYTLRARQINQRQLEIIKFIGGIIMILLGIVLLVNPALIGIGIG